MVRQHGFPKNLINRSLNECAVLVMIIASHKSKAPEIIRFLCLQFVSQVASMTALVLPRTSAIAPEQGTRGPCASIQVMDLSGKLKQTARFPRYGVGNFPFRWNGAHHHWRGACPETALTALLISEGRTLVSVSTHSLAVPCSTGYAEDLGCFQEPVCNEVADRALSSFYKIDSAMTVEMCQDLVLAAGYAYAAVQWHYQCFGGNDISQYVTPGTCSAACAGNMTQNCGGTCANRIFRLSDTAGEFHL
jgi:hypothetical protein